MSYVPGLQDQVVLGLIARHGPMTPYELKTKVAESVDYFWPIPHAQLYRIPVRLTEAGLLSEEAEQTGRRRRVFALTDAGREQLADWLADPRTPAAETRDPAQLKLFFADLGEPGDIVTLARRQAAEHRRWLDRYRQMYAEVDPGDTARALSRTRILALGIQHEQAYVEYWDALANRPNDPAPNAAQ